MYPDRGLLLQLRTGPVYFASLVFAGLIRNEEDFAPAYGSNVLGATVGGALEYCSLVLGFRALLFLTLGLYLLAFISLAMSGGLKRLDTRPAQASPRHT